MTDPDLQWTLDDTRRWLDERIAYQARHPVTDEQLDALIADPDADPAHVAALLPLHWGSESLSAWMQGGGVRQLGPYKRRGQAAWSLLMWLSFLFDNPTPRSTVRVSLPLLCHITSRTPATTRRYLDILHDADLVRSDGDDTYSRGLFFPYPALDEADFREDWPT